MEGSRHKPSAGCRPWLGAGTGTIPTKRRSNGTVVALVVAGVALTGIIAAVAGPKGQPQASPAPESTTAASDRVAPSRPSSPSGSPDLASEAPNGSPATSPPGGTSDYLLIPGAELQALPTSGPAWEYLVRVAGERWPAPDFIDQDNQTDTLALAAALVYARTGDVAMRAKARDAILAVIPTFRHSRLAAGLGPLRQTAGWVLAADFIDLDGRDDAVFRSFLRRVLTDPTGTHSADDHVDAAHDDDIVERPRPRAPTTAVT